MSSSQNRDKLYTIICDYDGTTAVEQFLASTPKELIEKWIAHTQVPIKLGEVKDRYYEFSLLENLKNVWCTGFSDDKDVFFLLNIILTVND